MTTCEALPLPVTLSPSWQIHQGHGAWQRGTISIRQRVGEITLGHWSFPGAIFTHDFLSAPVLGDELNDLPVNGYPDGCDAIKIASAPVEKAPPVLRFCFAKQDATLERAADRLQAV